MAHPKARSPQRAAEGHDLIRLAPRPEAISTPAGSSPASSRPETRHRPCARPAVSRSRRSRCRSAPRRNARHRRPRRVAFHLKGHAFLDEISQVDCFIAASEAIRQILIGDASHRRGSSRSTRGSTSTAWRLSHRQHSPRILAAPHAPIVGAVGALTQEKDTIIYDAAALVVREAPDARFVILGEGSAAGPERQVKELRSEACPATRISARHSRVRALVRSFVCARCRKVSHVAPRRHGRLKSHDRQRHRCIPEVSRTARPTLVPPRDPRALASAIRALLKDDRAARRWAMRSRRVKTIFSANGYREYAGVTAIMPAHTGMRATQTAHGQSESPCSRLSRPDWPCRGGSSEKSYFTGSADPASATTP